MADTHQISPGQRMTRRRALGRRLIRKSSDLSIICADITNDQDLAHLTDAEKKRLDKALRNARTIAAYLNKLGTGIDQDQP